MVRGSIKNKTKTYLLTIDSMKQNVFTHMKGPDDPGSSRWHKFLIYLQLSMEAGSSFKPKAKGFAILEFNISNDSWVGRLALLSETAFPPP